MVAMTASRITTQGAPTDVFSTVCFLLGCYFSARTSAASTCGSLVRALRYCLRKTASLNPASLNSRRKATPSFAPAIHANQFVSLVRASGSNELERISSAAKTAPPRLTIRASSLKIASRRGVQIKDAVDQSNVDLFIGNGQLLGICFS